MKIMNEIKEKKIWESWLDEAYGSKLESIRTAVKELHEINNKKYHDIPFYTPHGPQHCQAVENLIHRLIGDKFRKISLKERYFLLASAWLHDLGMLKYVYIMTYNEIDTTPANIRKVHHITTAKFIVENWTMLKINESEKELIAKLCLFHRRREDLNECDKYFYVGNAKYRLRLLASYLRLADALDICSDRVPSENYAICLAYNIPDESKLHWIKSRIVNGVYLDDQKKKIFVQFKVPKISNLEEKLSLQDADEKLNYIIKIVTDDLRAELSSVMNVLAREKISYYLDIELIQSEVAFDEQMLEDLREIVINYDIMMAPSASRLLEIILVTFANIIGYSLEKKVEPRQISSRKIADIKHLGTKLINFINILEKDIISERPCHLGLMNLVYEIKNFINNSISSEDIISYLNQLYQEHHLSRTKIRNHSSTFFESKIKDDDSCEYNILLYGYSELVAKALCGLRDGIIKHKYSCINPKEIYNSGIEKRCSNLFNIYVCDGQPKAQPGYMDRYIYHDASQYAFYLSDRGFNKITILPDIISGTLINMVGINFIMVGANGITKEQFIHSAGHLSLIKLAKSLNCDTSPKVLLVTTIEKMQSDSHENVHNDDKQQNLFDIDGFALKDVDVNLPSRHHIWMIKDQELARRLAKSNICFINPREDIVNIEDVDYIITDKGWCNNNEWRDKAEQWHTR